MAVQITINNITGASPYNVYVCDTGFTTCVFIATISSTPFTFTVPAPLDNMSDFAVKAVDSNNCSITGVIAVCTNCPPAPTATPVPSPTPSPTPGPTPTSTSIPPTPTPTPVVFSILDMVLGYNIGRYYYDVAADLVVDAGNSKIFCWATFQAIGKGEVRFMLHDTTNVFIDTLVAGFNINNMTTAGNGFNSSAEAMPTNGYDQILVELSTDSGATWSNLHIFPISTDLTLTQGTLINNGNTANSSTHVVHVNEAFVNTVELGTAGNTADYSFSGFTIARLSGTIAKLPVLSGTLTPVTGILIGGATTGNITLSGVTMTVGDSISPAITYGITLNVNTGPFFVDVSAALSLGLRALGVGTFVTQAGIYVQPVIAT